MCLQTKSFLQNGKYRVIRVLGNGGFGITYEAEQVALHRRVAVKEFFMKDYCERDETTSHVTLGTSSGSKEIVEKFRNKFIREAQMIASLDHPHIVKIHDVFEENGTAYYVMEFLEGGSLADLVKKSGPMPEERAIDYIRQVGDALSHLHNQNCLHFDVKPSNILLNRARKAVLIDFGISKHYDEVGSQTSSTPVGISKGYAPLEQYQPAEISTFTPATDIYALGATLFFLLTGQTPPSASEVNENGLPPLPSSLSLSVKNAINIAMAPRRKDRPQNVSDFMSLIDDITPLCSKNANEENNDTDNTYIIKPVKDKKDTKQCLEDGEKRYHVLQLNNNLRRYLKVFLFILLGFSIVFFVFFELIKYPNNSVTSIHINSDPEFAEIWIDGKYTKYKTPAVIKGLTAGDHHLVIKKDGYNDFSSTITINKRGESEPQYFGLHRISNGSLQINSTPSGATIIIDGVTIGYTTPHLVFNLRYGSHSVRLTKDGYIDAGTVIEVSPNTVNKVDLSLYKK